MVVIVQIDGHEAPCPPGATLFELARQLGVLIPTSCLGQGKCRECLLEVEQGMELLSPREKAESHLEGAFRLSCQTRVTAGEGAVRCHTLRRGAMRIESSAAGLPTLGDLAVLDPPVHRDGAWVLIDDRPVCRSDGPLYGLALDLGTTTVVVRLVDLQTGMAVASEAFENPQRFGGSDVLARVRYDTEHKGQLLRRTLLGYLKHAVEALPCRQTDIYEMAVAGNTTMRDIFFGLDVRSIGHMPYRSITEHEFRAGRRGGTSVELSGKNAHAPIHPEGRVYGLPLLGSHVGADAAACLLAVGMADQSGTVALMDIGTNTELILGCGERIHAASCPAGPAFEGGRITCGMPALEGAIERVAIGSDGKAHIEVIGGGPAIGICGSGLIDLLSELLRTGGMNQLGRLRNASSSCVLDAGRKIAVTEEDISYLAQAKAANAAGLTLVFRNFGVTFSEVERFYLAGGFAKHLDPEAACRIGLIPDIARDKFVQIGNASLAGATLALLSKTRRAELELLAKSIEHVELEGFEDFFDVYTDGLRFATLASAGPCGSHERS